jgi:uncharacterized membrane protein
MDVFYNGLWCATAFNLPFALYFGRASDLGYGNLVFTLLTGLLLTSNVVCIARSYESAEIHFVYPISRGCGVVGIALLGYLLLGEKLSVPGAFCVAAVAVGTLLLSLDLSATGLVGKTRSLPLALGAGLSLVGAYLIGKKITHGIDPFFYSFGMYLVSAITLTPFLNRSQLGDLRSAWKEEKRASLVIGIGSTLSYLLILFAFRSSPAGHVIAIRETSVVMASLFGLVFLGEPLTRQKAISILLITGGAILLRIF